MIFKYVFKKILHLSIRVCFFNNKPTLQEQPTPENPSQTRPIPIEANQLAPVQSTRHSCWVPEGSGQAVPTTQPAPIYYRGMLSYWQLAFIFHNSAVIFPRFIFSAFVNFISRINSIFFHKYVLPFSPFVIFILLLSRFSSLSVAFLFSPSTP